MQKVSKKWQEWKGTREKSNGGLKKEDYAKSKYGGWQEGQMSTIVPKKKQGGKVLKAFPIERSKASNRICCRSISQSNRKLAANQHDFTLTADGMYKSPIHSTQ